MDLVPKRAPDSWLFFTVVALVATGVVMVYSASAIVAHDRYGDSTFFFKRQVAWAGLGMMALLIMQRTHYARLRRLTPLLLIGAVLSLALVLVPGIGRGAGGARRWIVLAGAFGIPPSQGANVWVAVFLAPGATPRARAFTLSNRCWRWGREGCSVSAWERAGRNSFTSLSGTPISSSRSSAKNSAWSARWRCWSCLASWPYGGCALRVRHPTGTEAWSPEALR